MQKFISLLIFFSLPATVTAKVSSVQWLEKPKITQSADIADIFKAPAKKVLKATSSEDKESEAPPLYQPSASAQSLNSMSFGISITDRTKGLNNTTINKNISSKQIKKHYSSRIPTMTFNKAVPKKCHPYYFNKELEQISSADQYILALRNYFKKCGKKLADKIKPGLADLASLSYRKYKVFNNKKVSNIKLTFDSGQTARGFLALKDYYKSRPLVIVKCGIFCDGKSSSINNMILAALHDAGPFNILLLANNTGPDNIKENKRINFGGFLEGQELIEVAQWVKNESYLRFLVTEVHVLGISLGGHAALYTSLYNEYLEEKVIDSVIAFCPVVNLENSLKDLLSGATGPIAGYGIRYLIEDNYDHIPYLQTHFDLSKKVDIKAMPRRLAATNVDYLKTLDPSQFLPPFDNISLNSVEDFYQLGDFARQAVKVSTPTFVWGSKNDFLVQNRNNSGLLQESFSLPSKEQNISVLNVRKGSHCAVAEPYSWHTVGKVLNSFFVKNSPSLQRVKNTYITPVEFPQPQLRHNEQHIGQKFLTFSSTDSLIIEYKIYQGPRYKDPFYATPGDFRYVQLPVKFNQLPFDLKIPRSHIEAKILTRWLNSNVVLKSNDELAFRHRHGINQIEWTSYQK